MANMRNKVTYVKDQLTQARTRLRLEDMKKYDVDRAVKKTEEALEELKSIQKELEEYEEE